MILNQINTVAAVRWTLIAIVFCLLAVNAVEAQKTETKDTERKSVMKNIAKGTFEVKSVPQAPDAAADPSIGRLLLTKQFAGDIDGTSTGQMLGVQSAAVEGSGGYVAMERITGTLHGRKGSFVLQHIGTMQGGKFDLNIGVVPDSGTDELKGVAGKFKIIIEGGKHFYEFEYSLPVSK